MASSAHVEKVYAEPFPTNEKWDAHLSPEAHRRLSWQDKQRRSMVALRRKVALLQDLSNSLERINAEPNLPEDRKSLRVWHDPARGLWTWDDVKLDNPNNHKNKTVIEAFFKALDDISETKKGKSSVLKRKIKAKEDIIERLELRNAELLEEILRLRARLARFGVV